MIRLSVIMLSAFLLFVNCKVVEDDSESSSQTYKTFRIAAIDVSPWTFENDWEWQEYGKDDMYTKVDGDATTFIDNGMICGAAQRLVKQSDKLEIWIMTFSSNEIASAMFQKYVSERFSSQKSVPGFSQSVAVLDDSNLDGCRAIARFSQFIIITTFTNYSEKSKSITDAEQFLKVFQKKQQ